MTNQSASSFQIKEREKGKFFLDFSFKVNFIILTLPWSNDLLLGAMERKYLILYIINGFKKKLRSSIGLYII